MMDEITLRTLVSAQITDSLGYYGGALAQDRLKAMEYYYGQPFGNEIEGRSQVVSRDVAEIIEAAMPSLMRIFASGDEVVKFVPSHPGDEQAAEQASDYVNWIWTQQNEGFRIFHDWIKDALLQKLGVIKIWWDTQTDLTRERYAGLTEGQMQMLAQDDQVEIVSAEGRPDLTQPPQPGPDGQPQPQMIYDVIISRTREQGRVRIVPIPPEEFLCERRSTDLDRSEFLAHRVRKTVSDLIAQGYDPKTVRGLTSDEGDYNMERIERFAEEDELPFRNTGEFDPSMRPIWVTECYLRVDYDGDGIAELRKITVAGASNEVILDNEEVDNHPFAALTPILMPHKLYGQSLADLSQDIQLIKSTLWRQALDNLYLSNNARMAVVDGQVNLDDLLTSRPGGIVRVDSPDAIQPLTVPNVAANALQMVEYVDSVRENRTGISAYNQGLDADTLNKTATGIQMIQEAGNQRLELIARVFAETGVKQAFRRILELVCRHQDQAQVVRMRGKWINIDPRAWRNDYDLTVEVGLGNGNKRAQFQAMQQLLMLDQQIIGLQGGVQGPILTLENIYNKLARMVEALGHKNVDTYYTDPATQPPPQPPQPHMDPKVQAQMQAQATQMQIAQLKAQAQMETERMRAEAAVQVQQMKALHEMHLNEMNAATQAAKGMSYGS